MKSKYYDLLAKYIQEHGKTLKCTRDPNSGVIPALPELPEYYLVIELKEPLHDCACDRYALFATKQDNAAVVKYCPPIYVDYNNTDSWTYFLFLANSDHEREKNAQALLLRLCPEELAILELQLELTA